MPRFPQTPIARQRDLESVLKALTRDRSPIGSVARTVFGNATPPGIFRVDDRIARMAMRVALTAPLYVRLAVIASIGRGHDRMFAEIKADGGMIGICAHRQDGVLHVARIDMVSAGVGMTPMQSSVILPETPPKVDWRAVAEGRWRHDATADRGWWAWGENSFRMEPTSWAPPLTPDAAFEIMSGILVPDLITLALMGVLPQLPAEEAPLPDWAKAPAAGNA